MVINYYSNELHEHCTIITQYAKIILLSLKIMKNALRLTWVRGGRCGGQRCARVRDIEDWALTFNLRKQ